MSRRAPRFASRQVALQALYAVDLASSRSGGAGSAASGGSDSLEAAFESVAESFGLPEAARAFAKDLVFGVMERRGKNMSTNELEQLSKLIRQARREGR